MGGDVGENEAVVATRSTATADEAPNGKWLLSSKQLDQCRIRANREGIQYLKQVHVVQQASSSDQGNDGTKASVPVPDPSVQWYASGYAHRKEAGPAYDGGDESSSACAVTDDDSSLPNPPLTPEEELLLITFYSSKIRDLIGPKAILSRLKRDIKVTATASALFRRFYLSNSVMSHDPKALMVACAFLASKVEDATVDIRYLEEATKQMQAPVTQKEILMAEISLISGVHFELLCAHPYKTVLALTEDLRTYLKTDRGRKLAKFPPGNEDRPIVGEDLRPMHDEARRIVDDACVSDAILLASPGQIGLAAMIVANQNLQLEQQKKNEQDGKHQQPPERLVVPNIDLMGYMATRFDTRLASDLDDLRLRVNETRDMLQALREGKYGCGNNGVDMVKLKAVHKKWKKCRSSEEKSKKKKKKKRKANDSMEDTAPAAAAAAAKKHKV